MLFHDISEDYWKSFEEVVSKKEYLVRRVVH